MNYLLAELESVHLLSFDILFEKIVSRTKLGGVANFLLAAYAILGILWLRCLVAIDKIVKDV